MIDIKELRRLAQAATPHVGHACEYSKCHWLREGHVDFENADLFIASERPQEDAAFYAAASPQAILELLNRLEAAESECLEQARLNGMGGEREAALLAKLEAAEKDIAIKEEVIDSLAAVVKRLDAQCDAAEKERDALRAENAALVDDMNLLRDNNTALRAKITEMEKQEPFDADSDVFRGAFEAALKAGNWPATRQGDGYRSPSTQIAWRIAFSTVNRLKLYALPGAKTQGEEK